MDLIYLHMPALLTLGIGTLVMVGLHLLARKTETSAGEGTALAFQLLMWASGLVLVIALVITLPISDTIRGQVLSLLGVVISAIIALSSTTFVSNAMAGIMLQATRPFRPGDFIEVNGVFGRVTHRALIHTRLQTETRDFTTLPNLLLVTAPVTVLHREGTIIQADVSLGYDVHHHIAERYLLEAANDAGLQDPYVLITELFDHAVGYRIAGFLADINNPLSARSALRRRVLDSLHHADIEITSPSVVAQRRQAADQRTLPPRQYPRQPDHLEAKPEQRIFDSADAAAAKEKIKQDIVDTRAAIQAQQTLLKELSKEQRPPEEATLRRLEQKLEWLKSRQSDLTEV